MIERPILFSGPMVRAILDGTKTQTRRIASGPRAVPRRKVTADRMPGGSLADLVAVAPPTRYPVRLNPLGAVSVDAGGGHMLGMKPGEFDFACPYADGRTYLDRGPNPTWRIDVAPDQRLWVRETHAIVGHLAGGERVVGEHSVRYRATWDRTNYGSWRPSIHMPRWASRLTLEVTEVRVEKLRDIVAADALAEGAAALLDPGHPLRSRVYKDHGTWTGDSRDIDGPFAGAVDAFATLWDSINAERAPWASNPWVWAITFRRVS